MKSHSNVRSAVAKASAILGTFLTSNGSAKKTRLQQYKDYVRLAKTSGLDQRYLFLSFDCDTDWDIDVVTELHSFLASLDIKMTMAVPGAQLQKGAETYERLAEKGVEYMNHGALPHAKWEVDQYVSTTFYEKMESSEVVSDIKQGHEIVRAITKTEPKGFRAPHFGHFQRPDQLDLIYETARNLGYTYCSTTVPEKGLTRGPVVNYGGLLELPTFGSASSPTCILDTWTYLADRKQYKLQDTYFDLFAETIDFFTKQKLPALFTWYGDPSHVVGQRPFEKAMELIHQHRIPSLSGQECAQRFVPRPRR